MAISLCPMTDEMYHSYFKDYENDPDLYWDKAKFRPYVYCSEAVDRYIERRKQKHQIPMAIVYENKIVGELIFKELVPNESVAISIALRKSQYKDHGYGTQAERLALSYAFETLNVRTVYADTICTNTRSQHVLQKVGFVQTHCDEEFIYYQYQR